MSMQEKDQMNVEEMRNIANFNPFKEQSEQISEMFKLSLGPVLKEFNETMKEMFTELQPNLEALSAIHIPEMPKINVPNVSFDIPKTEDLQKMIQSSSKPQKIVIEVKLVDDEEEK